MDARYGKGGADDEVEGAFSQDDDVVNHGAPKNQDEVADKDKKQAKKYSSTQIIATEDIAQSVGTLQASNWN